MYKAFFALSQILIISNRIYLITITMAQRVGCTLAKYLETIKLPAIMPDTKEDFDHFRQLHSYYKHWNDGYVHYAYPILAYGEQPRGYWNDGAIRDTENLHWHYVTLLELFDRIEQEREQEPEIDIQGLKFIRDPNQMNSIEYIQTLPIEFMLRHRVGFDDNISQNNDICKFQLKCANQVCIEVWNEFTTKEPAHPIK
jgi:hypothetical protein